MKTDTSIRRTLLMGILGAILLIWAAVIGLVYQSTFHEIEEIYDASLASYARVLATLISHEAKEEQEMHERLVQLASELGMDTQQTSPTLSALMEKYRSSDSDGDYLTLDLTASIEGHHYESRIAYLVKANDGRTLIRSSSEAPFEHIKDGYQTIQAGDDHWRVFGLTEPEQGVAVMVGQHIEVRMELEQAIIANVLWPFLAALPIIALVIWAVISKGLSPLKLVADKVSTRSPASLDPISQEAVPIEILPLVNELNHLFQRVSQAMENERRFTANAAHELRTPLAALKVHVQVLQLSATDEMQSAISAILQGIDRATHLVEQLLTLARTEARATEGIKLKEMDLLLAVKTVMSDLTGLALDKEMVLSLESQTDKAMICGDDTLVHIVIRNLLDNAIRYAPTNGTVKINLYKSSDKIHLRIEDSGPGILPEKQDIMMQRFQRGDNNGNAQGVGLGLFIVNQIIQLHNIELDFSNASDAGGLVVDLTIPSATSFVDGATQSFVIK